MTDDELLKAMGLSDEELRDLLARTDAFFQELGRSERKVVKETMPSIAEAAKTFGRDVTPAELTKFLKARAPRDALFIAGYFGSSRKSSKP
jgi:hypothetical protein